MVARLHLIEHPGNEAVFVYHHRGAVHAVEEFAVQRFGTPDAIRFEDGFVGIGQQRERELVFGLEPEVRCRAIGTDAEHLEAALAQRIVVVAEVAGFCGAAGCVVFGIKKEDELFTSEIGQCYGLAVFVYTLEIGGGMALLKRYF